MNKQELVQALVARCSDDLETLASTKNLRKRKAENIVDTLFDIITDTVANGENVRINDFGTFTAITTKATCGFNPNTHAKINISSKRIPKFRAHAAFKQIVNDAN